MAEKAPVLRDTEPNFVEAIRRSTDDIYGPVLEFGGERLSSHEGCWWVFGATISRAPLSIIADLALNFSSGTSIERHEALLRAAGETIERYSALTSIDHETCIEKLWMKDSLLGLRFPRCSDDEPCGRGLKGRPTTRVSHVHARDIASGSEVLIPACHVHLGFRAIGEDVVGLPISTGLAFAVNQDNALESAICELVERDAIMLAWWGRRVCRRIDPVDSPPMLADRLYRLEAAGVSVQLFDCTSDVAIPTVLCLLSDPDYPAHAAAASSKRRPHEACAKAIDEAVGIRFILRRGDRNKVPSGNTFNWVQSLEQHAALYAERRFSSAFDFLLRSKLKPVPLAQLEERAHKNGFSERDLSSWISQLIDRGLHVLWRDVTAPEFADVGTVARVIIPELVPLSQDHRVRWLGTPRLTVEHERDHSATFNKYPHPLA